MTSDLIPARNTQCYLRATGAFGPFQLDAEVPRLIRGKVQINLRLQALHALRALVGNNGRCISYEEMIQIAWHGNWVSRHTVAVTVNEVRKALQECGDWISYRPNLGYRFEIPHAEELLRRGWHHWQRHTPEGFEKALECFHHAIDLGVEFRAYEGMSRCYLMLGIFAMRHPREMFAAFTEYHVRAVKAGAMTPELRGDLAQSLHMFQLRFREAEEELRSAEKENPRIAGTYIRLTVLYVCLKRFDEALDALRQAYVLDSLSPTLPACETMLHRSMGNLDLAIACGKKSVDLHPYLALGRSQYAQALEQAGKLNDALTQYKVARTLSPDLSRLLAEEAHCLARMGRYREARATLGKLRERGRTEFVDSCTLAPVYEALGKREEALKLLEDSFEAGSPHLSFIDVDYRMDPLRSIPRFVKIRNRVFRGVPRYGRTLSEVGIQKPRFAAPVCAERIHACSKLESHGGEDEQAEDAD